MPRRLAATFLICLVPLAAHADGTVDKLITKADRIRLEKYGESRRKAIAEAKAGGDPQFAETEKLLAKPLKPFSGLDMTGAWKCRTVKLGGLLPFVDYPWFKCRVTDDGSGWMLSKLTGSQRTTGRFYDDGDKRLIYLGSFSVNEDRPKPYGSGPETDQVGYAFRTGPKEWRIEFPAPAYESTLDILEFQR
ncbi:MAG: DUF4893 domain-containing protein [Rhizobiales bacterium]|nr:DUF4893 domain-containing protein [Hyphomicrobiales bacterium]